MRAALVLALALVPACSLWNRPAPFDAGPMDAPEGLDADAFADAPDAPDAPPPRPRESNCTDTVDNDDDGLTDCADPDCASAVEVCCSSDRPGPVIDEDWCDVPISAAWRSRGMMAVTDMAPAPCFVQGRATPAAVDSLVHSTCVPLVSGAVIRASLDWGGSCPECELMVALSPVNEAGPSGILEDLALRMHEDVNHNVVVDLTRAGRRLGTLPQSGSLSGIVDATLTLFPALDDLGRPVLRASLALTWDDGAESATLDPIDAIEHPIVLSDAAAGCTVAPGLFLGVQSRGGDAGRVGLVSAQPQQCANPNAFRPAGLPPGFPGDAVWLEAPDLGFTGASAEWTEGGIGSGATIPIRDGADVVWHWFVDGSNENRANDADSSLDFSIGGSRAVHPGLIAMTPRRSGAPLAGHLAPTCPVGTTMGCGMYDYREPALFTPRAPDGALLPGLSTRVVWVDRDDAGGSTLALHTMSSFTSDTEALATPPTASIDVACEAPRHPAILSRDPSGTMGHLLVFVCEEQVWGVLLDPSFTPVAGTERMLFDRMELGFPRGVLDVDGAVFGGVYRLWVAGRDLRGLTRIALTEARIPSAAQMPEFVPFGGNPVLSIDDPLFTRGPDRCVGTCRITGVGVAREPGAAGTSRWGPRVRVLVSVTDEGAVLRHAIVPLEQIMP